MSHWNGVSDSGILRKPIPTENHDELLVFGYACKLFRDDEKAIFIDQGKHLIPWMGDQKLKIDRYDCRGALSDLSKYEASKEGYDATRWLGLSDKERQLEELCDNERYYSLKINEEEEEMYKEEDLKRKNTNAIHYSYDVPQNPELKIDGVPTVPEADEVDEEYIPPPTLDVPVDIEKPKTVKENARIEKTALFVCRQGLQMEILIKAKQADNPQFSFLNQGDPLYKFYRHVLAAFKNGRYQGYVSMTKSNNEEPNNSAEQDSSGHYLHPSLLSSNSESESAAAVIVPQIQYKPSQNCSYSQLVNRIQGSHNDGGDGQKPAATATPDFSQMTCEQQQQYYQYYYAQQYYEYYKQMALYQQGQGGNSSQFVPPPDIPNLDPAMQAYIQQIAYQQYLHHQSNSNSSYAQIVSNISKDGGAYPPRLAAPQQQQDPVVYGPEPKPREEERTVTVVKSVARKPLLPLADYSSGSDSEPEGETPVADQREVYRVPTGDALVVIDKMAMYVSKNGDQFEDIVRAKNDPRLGFLNAGNEFNKYYRDRLRELKGEAGARDGEKVDDEKGGDDAKKVDEEKIKDVKVVKKEKKVIAPVSFSIKKAKEDHPKELKSALPVEESDDEEEAAEAPAAPVASTPVASAPVASAPVASTPSPTPDLPKPSLISALIKFSENQKKLEKEKNFEDVKTPERDESGTEGCVEKEDPKDDVASVESKPAQEEEEEKVEKIFVVEDDPILEMIELTDDADDERNDDHADDKATGTPKDKPTSAARERALQMERKRKAAAFLRLKTANAETPSRRGSIEIIEIPDESPPKEQRREKRRRDRSRSKERDRSGSRDRNKEGKRRKDKKSHRGREKTRRSEVVEVKEEESSRRKEEESSRRKEEESSRRKEEERREKKKKSHKRKHSKTKKKSNKRRYKHSDTDSSNDGDSSS